MKNNKINSGFSSLEVLITLIVLSVLLIAFSYFLSFQKLKITKYKKQVEAKKQIELCFSEFIEEFKEKLNPDFDGPNDEIYKYEPNPKFKCKLRIRPLSGLVELNYLPIEFYSKPYFVSLINENADPSFITEYRNMNKLITSYNDVAEYFSKEAFENISLYSIVNINTAEEHSFETLCSVHNCMPDFSSKRYSLSFNKQYMKTETEASLFFGLDYDKLKPFITVEAPININFANPDFINSLLSLKRFELLNYDQKCSSLFNECKLKSVNKETICNILGISINDELYYYIGCKTYFWEVLITLNNTSCKYVLFRNENNVYLLKRQWL